MTGRTEENAAGTNIEGPLAGRVGRGGINARLSRGRVQAAVYERRSGPPPLSGPGKCALWTHPLTHSDPQQLSARSPQASRRYCNESGRHFGIYLLENWTNLDKTWQRDRESDPVKFWARSLQKPQRKGKNANLFRDEYHAPV